MSVGLFEKLCGKKTEDTFIYNGASIVFQALTQGDTDDILRSISGDDYLAKQETAKIPTLARAIVSIDGKPLSAWGDILTRVKQRKEIFPSENSDIALQICTEEFLRTLPASAVNTLYKAYGDLVERDRQENEKLKKAWASTQPELSGK